MMTTSENMASWLAFGGMVGLAIAHPSGLAGGALCFYGLNLTSGRLSSPLHHPAIFILHLVTCVS
jgi:hypothetical protein